MSTQNICNICGANYEYRNGRWICPACGAYKEEELSNEEVTLLYHAAQKLRLSDFDESEKAYSDIIEKFPKNPSGYWGRLLSKYGIKYEEDFDGRKIPTCYAASIESVMSDKDYIKAIELADADAKETYQKQAAYIERVRKEWIEKARKEKPYDIFICYKDSDLANGIDRTQDSIAAQDLYIHLTEQGYRVFFSRESLRDKVGEKYEPYIFNALSTAKVMLVYGSKSEYITSTWLKNEWTRYEKRVQAGEKKPNSLIVACDGFSPAELPKALSSMQCFDATKRSFYSDLDAVVKKIIKGEKKVKPAVTEKKKSKKVPFAIALISVALVALFCILFPNLMMGDKLDDSIIDSKYGVVITAPNAIFDKNAAVIADRLSEGTQYTSLVSTVSDIKSVALENTTVYDIECGVDITDNVTVKVPYTKSEANTVVKVFYVSDDKTVVEEHSCAYNDGTVEFQTNHLSYYVIGEVFEDSYIYFDASGAGGTMEPVAIKPGERIRLPKNLFTKPGYTFSGWDTPSSAVKYQDQQYFTMPSVDEITLYAVWTPNTNKISFNANGGYGSMSVQYAETNEEVPLKENLFSRGGYTFVGWSTWKTGPVVYEDKDTYRMGTEASVTLYAVWTPNTNSIYFNANGGKGISSVQQGKTGEQITLNENPFTREGYTFLGWSIVRDSSVMYVDQAKYTVGTASSVTLYAVWSANTNELRFNANGGSGTMDPVPLELNETLNLPTNIFNKAGYTFVGWSDAPAGTVKYTDRQSFTMTSSTAVTLYAVWSANTNTIKFHANGGDGTMSSRQGKTDEKVTLPQNLFTRNGYTFAGWSTSANGALVYTDKAEYTVGAEASVTLYAVWSANENTIVFNANGGTGTMTAQTAKTGEEITLKENTFIRSGYTFLGWSTSFGGSVVYVNRATYKMGSASSVSLYAVWEEKNYKITYDLQGGTVSGNKTSYTVNTASFMLNNPQKEGYRFAGWTYAGQTTPVSDVMIAKGSTGDKAFTANWTPIPYTITYDLDGGQHTNATAYNIESAVVLSVPTKTGYTFAGWTYDGQTTPVRDVTIPKGSMGNKTFVAHWTPKQYTITYNANGGTVTPAQQVVTYGTAYTLATPKRDGYAFLGWFADGGQVEDGTWQRISSLTLMAQWEEINDYTLAVKTDQSDTGTVSGAGIYEAGSRATAKATPYLGYAFKGWYKDGTLVSTNTTYTFTIGANTTLSATFEEAAEMADFTFTATESTCTISGVKDKTKSAYVIPQYVTAIGDSAFAGCSNLSALTIPDSVTYVGADAFNGCNKLIQTEKLVHYVDRWAIGHKHSSTFTDEGMPWNVVLRSSTVGIAAKAFYDCEVINGVNIPDSVITIGDYAFAGCYFLRDVIIGNSVESIGVHAFDGCRYLEKIIIPDSVITIGDYAFMRCRELTEILLPKSVTSIGDYAFEGCYNLTDVIIGKNVVTIGAHAFDGCSSLNEIVIPDSVITIGDYAFMRCRDLTEIVLPKSVTSIGDSVFGYCDSLARVYYGGTLQEWIPLGINTSINSASLYCYSTNKPTTTGKYWHYVDGVPTPW